MARSKPKNPTVVNTTHRPKEERTAGRPPVVNAPQDCFSDEQKQIELGDLYSPYGKWSPEDKIQAAHAYLLTGKSTSASRHLKKMGIHIPHSTIRWWQMEATWWPEVYAMVKKQESDRIIAKLGEAQDLAIDQVVKGIKEGDDVVSKDGTIVKKQVSARDAATIAGIMTDKKQLIAGDPTSRSVKGNDSALDILAKKFEEFSKKQEEREAKVIDGERTK